MILNFSIHKNETDNIAASEISRFIIVMKNLESNEDSSCKHTVCFVRFTSN